MHPMVGPGLALREEHRRSAAGSLQKAVQRHHFLHCQPRALPLVRKSVSLMMWQNLLLMCRPMQLRPVRLYPPVASKAGEAWGKELPQEQPL